MTGEWEGQEQECPHKQLHACGLPTCCQGITVLRIIYTMYTVGQIKQNCLSYKYCQPNHCLACVHHCAYITTLHHCSMHCHGTHTAKSCCSVLFVVVSVCCCLPCHCLPVRKPEVCAGYMQLDSTQRSSESSFCSHSHQPYHKTITDFTAKSVFVWYLMSFEFILFLGHVYAASNDEVTSPWSWSHWMRISFRPL